MDLGIGAAALQNFAQFQYHAERQRVQGLRPIQCEERDVTANLA
jgi:hypothetical protein